jgi:protein-L-isoaspartate(D-aspartate) O-methyltransferase
MDELVKDLIAEGVLKTKRIIEAFLACDRKDFVPEELVADAYVDAPLPIGRGQTISQPYTVAFMIEFLDPKADQKILDIGFGSGWTAAILSQIVGRKGRVYALEIVPEVYEFGKANLQKLVYENVKLYNRSGWDGLPEESPFDRILVSAAAPEIPQELKKQLAVGGKMVIPVGSQFGCAINLLTKEAEDEFQIQEYPGFAFVPLVK